MKLDNFYLAIKGKKMIKDDINIYLKIVIRNKYSEEMLVEGFIENVRKIFNVISTTRFDIPYI